VIGGALLLLALAADPRARLEAVEARRAAEREAARTLAGRERSVLDTLEGAERAWRGAEAAALAADGARARSAERLEAALAEEGAAAERHRAGIDSLRPRLVALQRLERLGAWRLLLGSTSLADLAWRRGILRQVLSSEAAALRATREALAAREAATAERRAEADRLAALADEAGTAGAAATAHRDRYRALLATVRSQRQLHERAAAEAEVQGRRLAEFIATIPPRPGPAPSAGFARRRGRLPHPAEGPVAVGFGRVVDARFQTVTVQNGVDIAARRGDPVRAVAPGRVVHAGWFKGFGNLVIVDHGDGFHTLVAHLDAMTAAGGEEVEAGTPLGTVGDTGSTRGAVLHFEIRENGRPLDPRPWLAP
jgi:septal ring factor EnvC (AmiA/AmiB activator)